MDASGGLGGSGDAFSDELMAKADRIHLLAVKKRAEEISEGAGAYMAPEEEMIVRGSHTNSALAVNILPGSRDWAALEKWYSWIPRIFEPFTRLPEPSAFDSVIEPVGEVNKLFGGNVTGERGITTVSWGDMTSTEDWILDWYGEAATQFAEFADPFQYLPSNHAAIADVLYRAAAADKQVFTSARRDILKIADATIAALEGSDQVWGGDDISFGLSVVSAFAGFASAAATGGATLPIFFAAVASASAVAGEYVDRRDDGEEKAEVVVAGLTADTILDSMLEAINRLERFIETEEQKIVDALYRNIGVVMTSQPLERRKLEAPEPVLARLNTDDEISGKFLPPT